MKKIIKPGKAKNETEESVTVPSLEELMHAYGNEVLRLAFTYVKDYALAEDMFQEVFIKVNANLTGFRGEASLKTWILRITVNTCKDYLKSAYHKRVGFFDEEDTIPDEKNTADAAIEKMEAARIRSALCNLPEKYREVLVCLYFEDFSVSQTAQILGISEGTVKSRLSRGRDKLRNYLEESEGGARNG